MTRNPLAPPTGSGKRRNVRSSVALCIDASIAMAALVFALALRVGAHGLSRYADALALWLPLIAVATIASSLATGMHRRMWRHLDRADLLAIARTAGLAVLPIAPPILMLGAVPLGLPRSVPAIYWFVFVAFAAGARVVWCSAQPLLQCARDKSLPAERVPVLLAGTGAGSAQFIDAVANGAGGAFQVAGVLGADHRDLGRSIHGVPVLGGVGALPLIARRFADLGRPVSRVVVTEALDPGALQALMANAAALDLPVCRMPRPTEFRAAEQGEPLNLAPIPAGELLARVERRPEPAALQRLLAGRRIVVTGAGGSIGQELARQIAACAPEHLALIDASEFNLYSVDQQLGSRFGNLHRSAHLCDVRHRARVMHVFREVRPELVFHAAALKHVPLVELNVIDGMHTNVVGTCNVADAARAVGAGAMVMVSTDKAVNPVSVMGGSKRLAELYCQALDRAALVHAERSAGTRLMTVRFGNVLGSSGSVVPLFQRQLAAGGPLTVTHPDITRYFMTIGEAVGLLLQATAHAVEHGSERGEIFVLDMGEPVRIADLVRRMIRIAGLEPERDVRIDYVGLRPGEKLYEELFDRSEVLLTSPAPGVLRARGAGLPLVTLREIVAEVAEACEAMDGPRLRDILRRNVPGFGMDGVAVESVREAAA